MNQNELRIGNLLRYGAHGTATVIDVKASGKIKIHIHSKESHEKGYVNPTVHTVYLDPITLTPEWLERYGIIEKGSSLPGELKLTGEGNLTIEAIDEGKLKYYLPFNRKIEVKYLHQLQNLFFALTGEELQIKEP